MAYFYFLLSKVALLYFYGLECNGADIKLIKFEHILHTCTWILRSLHDYKCFMLYFVSDKNLKLTSTNVPVHVHCTYGIWPTAYTLYWFKVTIILYYSLFYQLEYIYICK
jgi:hypothetical protein